MDSDEDFDSGMGSLDHFCQRMNNFVGNLEMAVRRGFDDDPTIDLQELGCPPSPISSSRHQDDGAIDSHQDDLHLEQLQFICDKIIKKSPYGENLKKMMLQNLQKSLGPETFQLFLNGRMPKDWLAIVRMNDQNKPYVEFLIKSEDSDMDPMSQMKGITFTHLAYSETIIQHLKAASQKQMKIVAHRPPTSTPLKVAHRPPTSTPLKVVHRPPTSTPLKVAKKPCSKSTGKKESNNISQQRRQPERCCKLNNSMRV